MIELPDDTTLEQLKEFKRDLYRTIFDVTVRIQELEKLEKVKAAIEARPVDNPPDLGVAVSDNVIVTMKKGD